MFGYIKPLKPEMRVREYECYRAYYCGLCRAMGSCTGQCSRMTLSYDFVFLAAVRCYLAGETPRIKKVRCLIHPLRRRNAVEMSPQLSYCADASALLSYRKCKDDQADERGWKKCRAGFSKLFLSSAYRKARKRHPKLDAAITRELARLQEYECSGAEPSADVPAAIFGDLMKAVFSEEMEGSAARLAAEVGQTIGRWIYLVDAADDFDEDREKGRFNPFLPVLGNRPTQQDWEMVRTALTAILCETERAFLLFDAPPCPELKEIIANILYCGLPDVALRTVGSTPEKSHKKGRKGDRT